MKHNEKKILEMQNKDYNVYAERENWGETMYTIVDSSENEVYHTESYRDAVQTCAYLQTKLDNARWLEEVKNYGRQ